MKKIFCIILTLILAFCLAACDVNINISRGDDDDNNKKSSKTEVEKNDEDDEDNDESNSINLDGIKDIFDNSKKQTIIVGTTWYEPYGYIDNNGKWTGVEIEILEAIAKNLNYEFVYQECIFEEIISDLESGKIDLAATALSYTEQRQSIVNASIEVYPFFTEEEGEFAVFYTSKNDPKFTQLINEEIAKLQNDGTIDKIIKKYDTN